MKTLPSQTDIHLSLFLTNDDKCVLYESSKDKQLDYLIQITKIDRNSYNKRYGCLYINNGTLKQPRFFNLVIYSGNINQCIITDFNHLTKLKLIEVDVFCNIDGFSKLLMLEKMDLYRNKYITDINIFKNLREIVLGESKMKDEGISKLLLLEVINLRDNNTIQNIQELKYLKQIILGNFWISTHNFQSNIKYRGIPILGETFKGDKFLMKRHENSNEIIEIRILQCYK